MNAHTSREETAYYLRLLPEHLSLGVDILADILTESTLPEIEIERERGVIIQEIGQSVDTPDDLVFDLYARSAYVDHTLGRPILGTIDSVSNFGRGDLNGFLSRHYGAGQMLVCAAGAVTQDELVACRQPPIRYARHRSGRLDAKSSSVILSRRMSCLACQALLPMMKTDSR